MFRFNVDGKEIYQVLGYHFKDERLLLQALTRQSAINEGRQAFVIGDFQRLEHVGDGILDLVIRSELFKLHPNWKEGELSQEKAKLVRNGGPIAEIAKKLGLGKFLIMGIGEERNNNARENAKVLSDAMEAVIGAMWMDSEENYQLLKKFIIKHWGPYGLLPAIDESKVMQIIMDYELSQQEKSQMIKKYFAEYAISGEAASNIFEALIDSTDDIELIENLLKKQIDQEFLDEALINNIKYGDIKKVELLLKYGANPNTVTEYHEEYCIENEPCISNPRTTSALQLAITCSGRMEIVELLVKYKADVNWQGGILRYRPGPRGLMSLSEMSLFNRQKIKEIPLLEAALHLAVSSPNRDSVALVRLLLEAKADPNLQDRHGDTPLHVLLDDFHPYDLHKIAILEELLEADINPNIQNNLGDTVLHLILRKFNFVLYLTDPITVEVFYVIIKSLQENGADLNLTNKKGEKLSELFNKIKIPAAVVEQIFNEDSGQSEPEDNEPKEFKGEPKKAPVNSEALAKSFSSAMRLSAQPNNKPLGFHDAKPPRFAK